MKKYVLNAFHDPKGEETFLYSRGQTFQYYYEHQTPVHVLTPSHYKDKTVLIVPCEVTPEMRRAAYPDESWLIPRHMLTPIQEDDESLLDML